MNKYFSLKYNLNLMALRYFAYLISDISLTYSGYSLKDSYLSGIDLSEHPLNI